MKRLFLSALLCIGLLIPSVIQAGRKTIPVIKDAAFSLERNYSDFTSLPRITLHNKGKDEKIFELFSTLTDTDGRIIKDPRTSRPVPHRRQGNGRFNASFRHLRRIQAGPAQLRQRLRHECPYKLVRSGCSMGTAADAESRRNHHGPRRYHFP